MLLLAFGDIEQCHSIWVMNKTPHAQAYSVSGLAQCYPSVFLLHKAVEGALVAYVDHMSQHIMSWLNDWTFWVLVLLSGFSVSSPTGSHCSWSGMEILSPLYSLCKLLTWLGALQKHHLHGLFDVQVYLPSSSVRLMPVMAFFSKVSKSLFMVKRLCISVIMDC